MVCVRCVAVTSSASLKKSLPCATNCRACINCCIAWVCQCSCHVRSTVKAIPRRCDSGPNAPPFCPRCAATTPRQTSRDLVPGRSKDRPARHVDASVGRAGQQPAISAADRIQVGLRFRGGQPIDRPIVGIDCTDDQHWADEYAPADDRRGGW